MIGMTGLKDRYYKRNQQDDYHQEQHRRQSVEPNSPYEREYEEDHYEQEEQYPEHQQPQPRPFTDPYKEIVQRQHHQQPLQEEQEEQYPQHDEYGYYPHQEQEGPLSILDDIKNHPSPKGTFPVMIGGRPVDLHALEDYVVKISPHALSTLLRYRNARTIEEIKGYGKFGAGMKLKAGTLLLLLLAIGGGVLGIIMIMFLPEIMAFFQGGM